MPDNSLIFDFKGGEIKIKVKKKITLQADSDVVTVEASKGSVIKSDGGKLNVTCKNVAMTGNSGVKIESKASLEAKGATFKLEGSGTGNVKAGILNLN